jgi:hypothetical protein
MRTTEPLINSNNAKAVIKASLLSAVVLFALTVLLSFLSISGEEDDGALRGALTLIFAIPVFWLLLIVYFFTLDLFNPVSLNMVAIVQLILTIAIVVIPVLLLSSGLLDLIIPSLYGVIFLNIVLLPGAWILVKSTHYDAIKTDS